MAKARKHPPRVLVVYKKTTFERYGGTGNQRIAKLLANHDPTVKLLIESHEAHLETLAETRAALKRMGATSSFVHRVVTLGGDGTLLFTSHRIGKDIPTVAINSAPMSSVGFFCAGSGSEVESVVTRALAGELRATKLTRMKP